MKIKEELAQIKEQRILFDKMKDMEIQTQVTMEMEKWKQHEREKEEVDMEHQKQDDTRGQKCTLARRHEMVCQVLRDN